MLTFHVARTSSTSWRRLAGFRAFLRARASKHGLIQAQVGHKLLQPRVLLLELAQPAHLGRHQTDVLLAPGLRQVASLMPALRHTSPTAVPSSVCFSTKAIRASLNFDLFMVALRLLGPSLNWKSPARRAPRNGQQVIRIACSGVIGNGRRRGAFHLAQRRGPLRAQGFGVCGRCLIEPRRVCRRLRLLSRVEPPEQDDEPVVPGGARARGADGAGP